MNPQPEPERERGALSSGWPEDLDRAVRADLDRIRVDCLLAGQDAMEDLRRDLEGSIELTLAPSELGGSIERLEGGALPSMAELESLVVGEGELGLAMEGHLLTDLLDAGPENRKIIKRGLAFLKHGKHAEALEWWGLHRRGLDPATSALHLLLLIMEALTRLWSGDEESAAALRDLIRSHPMNRSRPGTSR
jgi:hypothetical protein